MHGKIPMQWQHDQSITLRRDRRCCCSTTVTTRHLLRWVCLTLRCTKLLRDLPNLIFELTTFSIINNSMYTYPLPLSKSLCILVSSLYVALAEPLSTHFTHFTHRHRQPISLTYPRRFAARARCFAARWPWDFAVRGNWVSSSCTRCPLSLHEQSIAGPQHFFLQP